MANHQKSWVDEAGTFRWVNRGHYFLKPKEDNIFTLGMEHLVAGEAYDVVTEVPFFRTEVADLLDKICTFNGLVEFSRLMTLVDKLQHLESTWSETYNEEKTKDPRLGVILLQIHNMLKLQP